MSAIAKTVWMIETHFGSPLSLDEMAAHAGVSPTYLSRIFPLATGFSLSGYTRARRLSEAAKALASGAPDILAIALDAGYGSHEAFTRAFRSQFGLTPADLRSRRSLSNIDLVEPLPMDSATKVKLDPPGIESMPLRHMAGLMERHDMSQANTIPAQWQRFQQYIGNVAGALLGGAYGVVADSDEHTCTYMCGFEVTSTADLPPEFARLDLAAGHWARIGHHGHVSTIRATIQAVFDDWLPHSGYRQADGVSFVEYYGPDFNPASGLGTMEVWIRLAD